MGLEAQCKLHYGKKLSDGKARLENNDLSFSGYFKLKIPLKDIKSVRAEKGRMVVKFGSESAVFDLGKNAEKWAKQIKTPKTRIEKLGVKPGMRVLLAGVNDAEFLAELKAVPAELAGKSASERDVIFMAAESKADLDRIVKLLPQMKQNGAFWVVRPKGVPYITEADTMAAGKAAGLVDVKVVSFSETHTAEKFVIPLADRK